MNSPLPWPAGKGPHNPSQLLEALAHAWAAEQLDARAARQALLDYADSLMTTPLPPGKRPGHPVSGPRIFGYESRRRMINTVEKLFSTVL